MPAAGDIAIIGYNTDQGGGAAAQSLTFVALRPLAAGTVIWFTDRAWTGTAFTAAGGDGTFSYTVPGGGLAAGAVITPTISGGASFGTGGDTIYAFIGTDANTPTTFLFAIDLADGNTTFGGNLTGTGLTAGINAAAVGLDIGSYHGPTNGGGAEYFMRQIADAQNWAGDDIDGQQAHAHPFDSQFLVAPDFELWVTGSGGGDGLVKIDGDGTIGGGNLGHNINRLYTDFQSGGNDLLYHPSDITFDTVRGRFYIADSDLNGHNRVLQGNIADLFNPSATPTLTVLFNNTATDATGRIDHMEVDPANGTVYFTLGSGFWRVDSNAANQAGTQLANFGTGSGNPIGTGNNFFNDLVIDFASGQAFFTSTRVLASAGGDSVQKNYLYRITGLDSGDGAGAFTFGNGAITVMPFSPQDNEVGTGTNNPGEAFPKEFGTLDGMAYDTVNQILYFSTGEVLLDDDQNSGTAPVYHPGGIYAYNLVGNPTGTYTVVWQQTPGSGPQGILSDLEIDPVTGRWYVLDTTGTSGIIANDGEGVWSGNLNGSGAPVLFATINNESGLTGVGLHLNRAPVITTTANAALVAMEASNAIGSGTSTAVDFIGALDATDFENADQVNQLAGATVWISTNLQPGDRITINGTTSGTSGAISWSYDVNTGVMSLTGMSTFDAYETLMQTARFTVSGDNPTAYGTALTRVLAWSVSDGILNSDAGTATVTVTGINDAPVNSVGAGGSVNEGVGTIAVTGISVSDVDANPATQDITVTLTAEFGVLTLLTNVSGGLTAGDISGNGAGTVTLTGTQNEINATLTAVNGLVLGSIPANVNGGVDITVVTNDGGLNGVDPGVSGGAGNEQDSDVRVITVTAVNDAPIVIGDSTETAATVTEDTPSGALTQTFNSVLAGQYSDAVDDQTANGGSAPDAFAGVAVVGNGSSAGVGQWQAWNGAAWVDIGTASTASAQTFSNTTPFRFNPAPNYNGPAPSLTVVLIDNSGSAITFGGDVNVTTRGGTTPYSVGAVVISQGDVTAVNDAPVVINGPSTSLAAVNEDAVNPAGDTVNNLFGSHFSDAADEVSGGSSANGFAGVMIGINNSNAAQGVWQVFTGGSWSDLPALDPNNTYLVSATDSLRFVPGPNFNGIPGSLTVLLIDDSAGPVVTGTRLDSAATGSAGSTPYTGGTVNLGTSVISVNDAPVLTADTVATFTEGQGAVALSPNLTVTDADHVNLTGATISIADFVSGDELIFVNQNGISGSYNAGTGVLTLTGTASVADYQQALSSIAYDNPGDANAGGVDNARTVNITVTDGVDASNQTATFVTIADGGGTAEDDAFITTESAPIVAGDLLGNNGSGADTGVTDITEVNGNPISYGVQFALPSGALLTIYSDGTFDYDPNGVFNSLVDSSSGAANSTATDSFTYTVDGGDTATVTVTINGETDSGDVYNGSGAGDTIGGDGTNNVINGLAGDDNLSGNAGGDIINGGDNNDTLNGNDGNDKLNGDNGDDILVGGEMNDTLTGGAGADDLVGGNGNDSLNGGTGADDMDGGAGNDVYFVDDAGDTITDASGTDTVKSTISYTLGAGLEHLTLDPAAGDSNGTGNASNNTINGNDFANVLTGLDGADKLYGFAGKDTLDGGTGADTLDGGDANDIIYGGAGNDVGLGGLGNDILNGGADNDQLDGGDGNDKLNGDDGNDVLTGGLGADTMTGGLGADTMTGGDGNDLLDGGAGLDKLYGGLGNDVYIVNETTDFVFEAAGEGYDVVRASANYTLVAEFEGLELLAGAGNISGTGNAASNAITGNEGDNLLDGKAGVDTIKGGAGNDTIIGGVGNDLMYGQGGFDTFLVRQESVNTTGTLESDRIYDLDLAGGDRIDLSQIDADSVLGGNQAFHFVGAAFTNHAGEATLVYDAALGITTLKLDVNGDGHADYQLKMDGDQTTTTGDIVTGGAPVADGGWIL
jgi:Ca2+-binding RTX toxin-like protein